MKMPTHKIITSDVGKLWDRRQPVPLSLQSISLSRSACQGKMEHGVWNMLRLSVFRF